MNNDHLKARSEPIQPGDLAPDFTLLDQHRNAWTLSDAVEKGDVVLCFYPLDFTETCGTEMECLTKEMDRWTDAGATMVGISCDSFAAHKAWAEQMGFKHTLLADMHRQVCKAYGLYWADLNVANRGTVVIAQSDDGKGKVKWVEAREPGNAMDWNQVLAQLS
ncbi:MAG: redoxin domain-containing protein [Phycisphaerales bacterium JB037]